MDIGKQCRCEEGWIPDLAVCDTVRRYQLVRASESDMIEYYLPIPSTEPRLPVLGMSIIVELWN